MPTATQTGSNGSTNTVQIYTAAEVAFNTVVGKTYQIQEATALSGGWQTISTNIIGNGAAYSYLTPTRGTTCNSKLPRRAQSLSLS